MGLRVKTVGGRVAGGIKQLIIFNTTPIDVKLSSATSLVQ
jgi:hypothetical protein